MISRTMTDNAPIIGAASASLLAQAATSPWWVPLLVQAISMAIAYWQGKQRERAAIVKANANFSADAPAGQHGGLPMTEIDDQP